MSWRTPAVRVYNTCFRYSYQSILIVHPITDGPPSICILLQRLFNSYGHRGYIHSPVAPPNLHIKSSFSIIPQCQSHRYQPVNSAYQPHSCPRDERWERATPRLPPIQASLHWPSWFRESGFPVVAPCDTYRAVDSTGPRDRYALGMVWPHIDW